MREITIIQAFLQQGIDNDQFIRFLDLLSSQGAWVGVWAGVTVHGPTDLATVRNIADVTFSFMTYTVTTRTQY